MFGNPDWFHGESNSVTPSPCCNRGWLYYFGWLSAIGAPATLLVGRGQFPEAAIWLFVSASAMLLDLRRLRRAIRHRESLTRMHFIGNEEETRQDSPRPNAEIRQPALRNTL
jgi:hypothetical protein